MPDTLEEKIKNITNLFSTFDSVPHGEGSRNEECPNCKHISLQQRDKVEGGGGSSIVTISYYCLGCGYYNIDEPYWTTSDY